MKKSVLLMLLLLCLVLCACGKEQPAATEQVPSEPETTEETTLQTLPMATDVQALPVVVTKNPTDEYLEYNWKCWFVAHADNATSVTWEFLSPEGTVHSVSETVEKNPNLFLDVSKGDTIALEHAPLSLNGWSVYARFEGPGGSATTDAAKITVKQSVGAYDAIISHYQEARKAMNSGESNWAAMGVSEMVYYASHVGYALKDLDGNGVEELIIAGIGYDIPDEPVVFEIFTIQNSEAVSVCCSRARSRFFLLKDNKIYNEGSGGAFNSNFSNLQLSGAELHFLDGLYTTPSESAENDSGVAFYYTTSNQYGDPSLIAGDNEMDEKIAQTFLAGWRGNIYLPELSFIE